MNQLIAIALGGAIGAVLRFLVSSGVYQWLGRGFPYGTLAVNIMGAFLIGLMTEALVLQRVALSLEFRSAILIGLFGSFTTFSTFSLETLYLIEQGNLSKASLNMFISVFACIFAVWLGLSTGKALFVDSTPYIQWLNGIFPYALIMVNIIGAFLIGLIAHTLMQKTSLTMEYQTAILIILAGAFICFSGLYLMLYLFEHGFSIKANLNLLLSVFASNTLACFLFLWLGLFSAKHI